MRPIPLASSRVAALALVATLCAVGCGNGSDESTAPKTVTKRFDALADTYVRSNDARTHFGRNHELIIDAVPTVRAYLRFEPFGVSGRIVRATLRLYSLTTSGDGFQVRATRRPWREATLSFRDAPGAGGIVALSGPLDQDAWKSIDVTSYARSHPTTLDLALVGTGETQLALASRESDRPPQLVVETRASAS